MSSPSNIVQSVFTVVSKQLLTPHYIRIVLTGDVALFKDASLGANNKIFIPPAGVTKVHMRQFDEATQTWILPNESVRPIMRTYTHRAINLEANELTIDFVNHGDEGPASAWARQAKTGDELGIAMKSKSKPLYPTAEHYVLIGDATALPVISVMLESLPTQVKVVCLLEVPDAADEQTFQTTAQVDMQWIHNAHPEQGSRLAELAQTLELPKDSSKFAFVAAEFETVKTLRKYFRTELAWQQQEVEAHAYWKKGESENTSADTRSAEKKSLL